MPFLSMTNNAAPLRVCMRGVMLFLLFGVLVGLGLRLFNAGALVFSLVIAFYALYGSLLLLSRFQARADQRDQPHTGGHLTEYVVLGLRQRDGAGLLDCRGGAKTLHRSLSLACCSWLR